MKKGTIKFYKEENGFGFIEPEGTTGKDIFFHRSGLVDPDELTHRHKGKMVTYEEKQGKKGPEAVNIELVD